MKDPSEKSYACGDRRRSQRTGCAHVGACAQSVHPARTDTTPDVVSHFRDAYNDCTLRYGDLKKQLAEDILKVTTPIRQRIMEIRDNDEYLSRVVRQGAEAARARASKTLAEVREIMGIRRI